MVLGVGVVEAEASGWVADPVLVDPGSLGFCATARAVASANAHIKTRNVFIDESPVDPTSQGSSGGMHESIFPRSAYARAKWYISEAKSGQLRLPAKVQQPNRKETTIDRRKFFCSHDKSRPGDSKEVYMKHFRQSRCLLASTTLVLFLTLGHGNTRVNAQEKPGPDRGRVETASEESPIEKLGTMIAGTLAIDAISEAREVRSKVGKDVGESVTRFGPGKLALIEDYHTVHPPSLP